MVTKSDFDFLSDEHIIIGVTRIAQGYNKQRYNMPKTPSQGQVEVTLFALRLLLEKAFKGGKNARISNKST